jgi:hypothetical protein
MWHKEIIPDKTINQKVTQELASRGMRAPCSIAVQTSKGVVTLSGNIEYEHQRNAAMQAARHLDGVSRVVDQLHVKAKASPWKLEPSRQAPASTTPIAAPQEEPKKTCEPVADAYPADRVTAERATDTYSCP